MKPTTRFPAPYSTIVATVCFVVTLTTAWSEPAGAQMAVDPRVNLEVNPAVQMGRQLDANPMLGARGVNAARPVSPLLQGNLYAQ